MTPLLPPTSVYISHMDTTVVSWLGSPLTFLIASSMFSLKLIRWHYPPAQKSHNIICFQNTAVEHILEDMGPQMIRALSTHILGLLWDCLLFVLIMCQASSYSGFPQILFLSPELLIFSFLCLVNSCFYWYSSKCHYDWVIFLVRL